MRRTLLGFGLAFVIGGAAPALAATKTVTGEVVDAFCFTSMGARGASHRQCGIECAKKGIPVGLLEKGTNTLYVLLPKEHGAALPDDVIQKMGSEVSVTGQVQTTGGSNFLTVESVK